MKSTLAVIAMVSAVAIGAGGSTVARTQEQAAAPAGYVWAGACKDCHGDIYEAWSKTKHARALERLSSDEQGRECVQCHVTGANSRVTVNGKVVNGGVQCERCHGPGQAHVKDPSVKGAIRREPGEEACTACHNEKSPHFKYFFYKGMASFSHPVKK